MIYKEESNNSDDTEGWYVFTNTNDGNKYRFSVKHLPDESSYDSDVFGVCMEDDNNCKYIHSRECYSVMFSLNLFFSPKSIHDFVESAINQKDLDFWLNDSRWGYIGII